MRLLVSTYFCPTAARRAGGVQQVVGPLLDGLVRLGHWDVTVAHPALPGADCPHERVADPAEPGRPDEVDPRRLRAWASDVRRLAAEVEVVLSVDRAVPTVSSTPMVLMSNTACYATEVSAVLSARWARIVVPSRHFAGLVRGLRPDAAVEVVPYGLDPSVLRSAMALPPPRWEAPTLVAALPHRPDRRKGHVIAVEGLGRTGTRRVELELAWLDEGRYSSFRAELEDLARRRGVADRVRIRPWSDGGDRWAALARAHAVLAVGPFEETFGLAAVEAVVAGRLAVASGQPAVREVLGASPLLVDVDDPAAWGPSLERAADFLAGEPEARRRRQPGELAEALALARMVDRYDAILRSVAGQETT